VAVQKIVRLADPLYWTSVVRAGVVIGINRTVFGLTEHQLKEQKYEIAQISAELGPAGLRQVGGMPICRLEDIFSNVQEPRSPGTSLRTRQQKASYCGARRTCK